MQSEQEFYRCLTADTSSRALRRIQEILADESLADSECFHKIEAIVSLLDGFCALGGFFLQIDITDAAVLREAQENPEAYKSLSVRVSGWNARFVTLDREWQQMIIERTEHMP